MNVDLSVFLQWMLGILSPVFAALAFWVLQQLATKLGLQINQQYWNTIHSAMCAGAERLVASQDASIATAKITIGNPMVAKFAQEALNTIPAEAKKVGFTPEAAQELLLSKLGGLQAQMVKVPTEGESK
jgi:ABC-type sulfate transport system permease component